MRKGIAKENNDLIASTTLKACNDMIIMIIIGELLSKTVFPPYRSGIYIHDNPDKQEDDDGKVSNLDDNNCDSTNKSSCSRQPCKHGSASEPIERTA